MVRTGWAGAVVTPVSAPQSAPLHTAHMAAFLHLRHLPASEVPTL